MLRYYLLEIDTKLVPSNDDWKKRKKKRKSEIKWNEISSDIAVTIKSTAAWET